MCGCARLMCVLFREKKCYFVSLWNCTSIHHAYSPLPPSAPLDPAYQPPLHRRFRSTPSVLKCFSWHGERPLFASERWYYSSFINNRCRITSPVINHCGKSNRCNKLPSRTRSTSINYARVYQSVRVSSARREQIDKSLRRNSKGIHAFQTDKRYSRLLFYPPATPPLRTHYIEEA